MKGPGQPGFLVPSFSFLARFCDTSLQSAAMNSSPVHPDSSMRSDSIAWIDTEFSLLSSLVRARASLRTYVLGPALGGLGFELQSGRVSGHDVAWPFFEGYLVRPEPGVSSCLVGLNLPQLLMSCTFYGCASGGVYSTIATGYDTDTTDRADRNTCPVCIRTFTKRNRGQTP